METPGRVEVANIFLTSSLPTKKTSAGLASGYSLLQTYGHCVALG